MLCVLHLLLLYKTILEIRSWDSGTLAQTFPSTSSFITLHVNAFNYSTFLDAAEQCIFKGLLYSQEDREQARILLQVENATHFSHKAEWVPYNWRYPKQVQFLFWYYNPYLLEQCPSWLVPPCSSQNVMKVINGAPCSCIRHPSLPIAICKLVSCNFGSMLLSIIRVEVLK